ncbi:MAG: hypothetical protein BV456_07475 [Thermoplasmata archaeon M8B2D]|nr:MAG: hypothetical protein BV456_07475 [Thermoplasmata archaeon M8B2D]
MTLSGKKIEQILALSKEGLSDNAISKKLKIDNHTVNKYRTGQIIPKTKSQSTQTLQQASAFEHDSYFNDDSHGFPKEHSQMREYKKQSNNRFTSHKERQEETHIPFSKWTVGGRPVSEFLRKPLDRPSETIRRPPVRTYGDFIPVPPIKKSEPQKLDIDD